MTGNVCISVVIPTYNEMLRKDFMQRHLASITAFFKRHSYSYEVLIVLDGPTDGTAGFIKNYAGSNAAVKVLSRDKNRGKGFSLREGMLQARGDIILFTDMDGATPIHMLTKFMTEFEKGYDIIIGSRKIFPEKYIKVHQPHWKEKIGEAGNVFIQLLLGLKGLKDTQCGFKAFTKEATKAIMPKTTLNRWGIDFEILVLARKMHFKIAEVPVEWYDSGYSLVRFPGYIQTLIDLMRVKWKLLRHKY